MHGEELILLGVLFLVAYVLGRLGKLIGVPAIPVYMVVGLLAAYVGPRLDVPKITVSVPAVVIMVPGIVTAIREQGEIAAIVGSLLAVLSALTFLVQLLRYAPGRG